MSDNFYTTTTAALKATKADIRNLNAQEIKLKDKNILDYIKDSEFDSYDPRDPQLKNDELDIWNTEISLSDNNHIEVKPFEHTLGSITNNQKSTLYRAAKIINNEVLDTDNNHLMYWQTDGLTDTSDFQIDPSRPLLGSGEYLIQFNSDLSSLTNGAGMFLNCTNLTSFTSDLSSLTVGAAMFQGCSALTLFNYDLPNLTNGLIMFGLCSNLATFTSDLSSLTDGRNMFFGCKLDAPSVANIVHTLLTHETGGEIAIGIGCDATEADQLLFAQECDCDTWQELLDDFSAKNWTVTFQCNGRPTAAATYNLRRGVILPIYAKLEEITNEKLAQYTSQDGSKFYNINYFHSTNGSTEGYDVFSSLEEAISTYNVTPKN